MICPVSMDPDGLGVSSLIWMQTVRCFCITLDQENLLALQLSRFNKCASA